MEIYLTYILYTQLHCITEPINGQSLDVIERAQFVVCLDQSHPDTSQLQSSDSGAIQDYQKSILANRVLHGNGSKQNSSNRWFDTSVQVNKHPFYMSMYNNLASLRFVPKLMSIVMSAYSACGVCALESSSFQCFT